MMLPELPFKPANRWQQYVDAEEKGTRNQKIGSLDRFIRSLLELPKENWMDWAIKYCWQHESSKASILIRQPLFSQVLFPAMINSWKSGVPGSLRLIARFYEHLQYCKNCIDEIPAELQSPELLLREELRLNPSDQLAGLMLVSTMARYIAHTISELPSGVLYEMNWASISECAVLTDYLVEFRELADQYSFRDNYRQLIHDASFHYEAYAAYLQRVDHALGYQVFLKTYSTP